MRLVERATITVAAGVEGDHKGGKFPRRAVTLLARDDWEAALLDLAGVAGPPDLDWTARRANLLVTGLALACGPGSLIRVGSAMIEVTAPTTPCARMDEVFPGLRTALATGGRGGVTARVVADGEVAVADRVEVLNAIAVEMVRLPG